MSSRRTIVLTVNLAFVNAVVVLLELAAHTLSPSLHAIASATVTLAFVAALVLREQIEVHPLAGAILVWFGRSARSGPTYART